MKEWLQQALLNFGHMRTKVVELVFLGIGQSIRSSCKFGRSSSFMVLVLG